MNLATFRHRPLKNLLFLNFTNDASYILVGKKTGFAIFRNNPTSLDLIMDIEKIPEYTQFKITALDVLAKSNLVALLIGGNKPPFDGNHVLLWDAKSKTILHDITFECGIHSVRMVPDRLIVILMTKIVIYNTSDGKCEKLKEYEMYWNEYSVIGLSRTRPPFILAFPGKNKGQVHCVDITSERYTENQGANSLSTILAGHNGSISAIAVSDNGQLVATASTNGTLIRVWKTRTGHMKNEFRRGVEYAQVYSLAFDPFNSKLAVISEKQTLHFFNLNTTSKDDNKTPKSATAKYLPKYFSSDWSIDKIAVPSIEKCLMKFKFDESAVEEDQKIILYMLAANGSLRSMELDPSGQVAVKEGVYLHFKT